MLLIYATTYMENLVKRMEELVSENNSFRKILFLCEGQENFHEDYDHQTVSLRKSIKRNKVPW